MSAVRPWACISKPITCRVWKFRQYVFERAADRRKSAVEQDQRLSFAVNLVVHVEAVHRNVVARPPGRRGRLS